jgi:putative membrane protein
MWGNQGFMGGYMWIVWIAVLIGLIILVKWIVQQSGSQANKAEENALEILKKRYARGEIDKQEFEQKKKDLSS